jgi:putative transposase
MKASRYPESQIIGILRQTEGGVPVAELCREHGMSNASFYKWRAKSPLTTPRFHSSPPRDQNKNPRSMAGVFVMVAGAGFEPTTFRL